MVFRITKKSLNFSLVVFTLAILSINNNLKAQSIDSCILVSYSTPPIVHVYGNFPHDGYEFTHFDVNVNSSTVNLDLFFKECAGNTIVTLFDTIYTPLSSWSSVPDTVKVNFIIDTNTIDLSCVINPTQIVADTYTIDIASLDIKQKSFEYFKVHPNPTSSILHLSNLLKSDIKKIVLYNSSGEVVKQFPSTSAILHVDELTLGYYILEITTPNKVIRKKVIIN